LKAAADLRLDTIKRIESLFDIVADAPQFTLRKKPGSVAGLEG
jgi:hypothetical protein